MNSINKNQPEDNHKDLTGEDAFKKMKALIEKATTCFFCTKIKSNESFSARPMTVQETDDEGYIWFLIASDSNTIAEIEEDASVQLLFQGSHYSDFLSLYGNAAISQDKAKIKDLWKPILKDWFTEGEGDPRIRVVKIIPSQGYYWDTKHGMAVSLIKRITGAAIGKTLDDSIEGAIKL